MIILLPLWQFYYSAYTETGWLSSVMVKGIGLTTQWSWVWFAAEALSCNSLTSCSHPCASVTKQYKLVAVLQGVAEVTAGLVESNGSKPPGLWHDSLHITCRLTACTPGSALGPMLGNEYERKLYLLPFYTERILQRKSTCLRKSQNFNKRCKTYF